MAKPKIQQRLQDFFTGLELPDLKPLPQPAAEPEQPSSPAAEPALSTVVAVAAPPDPAPQPTLTAAKLVKRAAPYRAKTRSNWNEFLDGIHRTEKLGFAYQGRTDLIQPATALDPISNSTAQFVADVQFEGSSIGKVQIERNSGLSWSKDDAELVNSVLARLSQQLETLQLIDEAERSREQAEQAVNRLSRQSNGNSQTGSQPSDSAGESPASFAFEFDQKEVRPAEGLPKNGAGLHVPIQAGGPVKGEFSIHPQPGHELSSDETALVETIAQRLSQQVQNLRFLDESRQYREQSEHAIQDLTRSGWDAYFKSAGLPQLAYQYDRNQVIPLPNAETAHNNGFLTQPLTIRDQAIGWFGVQTRGSLNGEDTGLVNVISDRLTTHLEGLRLAAQREQALSETELLYRISARLSTAQTLDEALTSLSEPAAETGVRDSRLFIINLDEIGQPESLSLAAIWYPGEGTQIMPVESRLTLADYPAYNVFLQDQSEPLLIGDVDASPYLKGQSREILTKTGAKALAALPLAISGRWVGLVFIHWENSRQFNDREQRLYSTLARQAAVVVNNRLLLEQTRKRAAELQTVAQVSTAASSILDPQELLQTVVDLTRTSFNLYHVQVYRYDYDLDALEVAAGSGTAGSMIVSSGILLALGENQAPVSRAVRLRQLVIMNDSLLDTGYSPNPLLPLVRAEIDIPLIVGDRLMGVFSAMSDTPNRFTREDARTFQTLASQISVALQNAELYAEQAVTVERLRELDHLKSSFMANMSHELRTPLNSILGFAEVLLLELDGPLTEPMINDVGLIQKNGKHLLGLISDVLDMAKIEAGKMSLALEKFQLRDLISESIEITGSLAREKGLFLRIENFSEAISTVTADRTRMRQVLINIISNAVKFTPQGGIAIHAEIKDENTFRIRVKDTGIGVPPDKLEMIFEAFSQVDTSTTRKAGGTGLGLPISRRLVEMHGGHLWAESSGIPGEGSTFFVELPFVASRTA